VKHNTCEGSLFQSNRQGLLLAEYLHTPELVGKDLFVT